MQGLRADSRFGRHAAAALGDAPFKLVDIGAPDGLAPGWGVFGERLRVLAVAGSPDHAAAVSAAAPAAKVIAESLAPRGPYQPSPWPGRFSFRRTQALRAGGAAGLETWVRQAADAERRPEQPADAAGPGPLGEALAARVAAEGFGDADFLRVDAGDADFEILSGAEDLLARPGLVGVGVRVRLFGSADARDNSFHNTDRLLRRHGFQPMTFMPLQFSAAALPAPYLDRHPDHTLSGRPAVAVVLYLRDLATVADAPALSVTKAAALLSLANLPDMAAELLLVHRQRLQAAGLDVAAGLDLLALQAQEDYGSTEPYADYIAGFERDEPRFYDVYSARAAWMDGLMRTSREAPAEISRLSTKVRELIRRLNSAERRAGRPSAETLVADAVRRSEIYAGHHWIFDHFEPYRGPATAEFYLDFIGARVRPTFESWGNAVVNPAWEAPLPTVDEEYFEWMDILQAVLEAGETFTMLELGAAYGRWSSRAALAARQLGKKVRLGLAEAEPKHQAWLRQHMADNGVAPTDYRTFDLAVGGSVDEVVFTVGLPGGAIEDTHFGHSVMAADLGGREPVGEYYGKPVYDVEGWRMIRVEQQPLSALLEPYDFIDIIDFDLQGAEAVAIAEALPLLTAKVRRLHIGTHGHEIEAALRDMLPKAGWICLRDFPCHGEHDTPFGPSSFVDGVQSWVNPRVL